MKNYFKNKTDANQAEIVKYLRSFGIEADCLGDPLDVFITNRNRQSAWLEIKVEGSKAKYTRTQLSYISTHPKTLIGIAKTKEQALAFANDPMKHCLSEKQKNAIAGLLLRNEAKYFQPKTIEEIL